MKIIETSVSGCLPLRQAVLRKGLSAESCHFPGDLLPKAIHLAIEAGDEIVCVVTAYPAINPDFTQQIQYQLRGMACDPAFQNQGAGSLLALHLISILEKEGAGLVWCNARQVAFSFYERLGFLPHGLLFNSVEGIPHRVMYRVLEAITG